MAFFLQQGPSGGLLSDSLGAAIGAGIGKGIAGRKERKREAEQGQMLSQLLFGEEGAEQFGGLSPELQLKASQVMQARQQQADKQRAAEEKSNLLKSILGLGGEPTQDQIPEDLAAPEREMVPREPARELTEKDVFSLGLVDPQIAKIAQSAQQESVKKFERERDYHTKFVQEIEKKVSAERETLPRKEMALDFALDAVKSGEVGSFTKNNLADAIGGKIGDALRTTKGAQLVTAGKENLLNNLNRVSARAQNLWMEQRLASMFPKIGQTQEANETVAEMLNAELSMDRSFVKTYDRLSEEDEKKYGYVRKDISKRVAEESENVQKEIFDRSSHRIREIQERELGLKKLKGMVGKKVARGTPMTLGMLKLYSKKFGDKALKVAKQNGYKIPTFEQYQTYQKDPQEFREQLGI